jgi:hypothetical protein
MLPWRDLEIVSKPAAVGTKTWSGPVATSVLDTVIDPKEENGGARMVILLLDQVIAWNPCGLNTPSSG